MNNSLIQTASLSPKGPNVYAFSDLRGYLEAWKSTLTHDEGEDTGSGSFHGLSQQLGVPSRTKMRRMFKGTIPVPQKVVDKIAEVNGFSADEKTYLGLL